MLERKLKGFVNQQLHVGIPISSFLIFHSGPTKNSIINPVVATLVV